MKAYDPNKFSLAILGSSEDQNMISTADVTVGLKTKYSKSDNLVKVDIIMNDIYALSYLLFKHGTISQRRLWVAT